MECFYFPEPDRRLLGAYHPPEGGATREPGVVLCCPVGQEYIRAHRAFVQFARRLSAAGFHCLRFDYSGCGDSQGDLADVTIDEWMCDISAAIDELRGGADVVRICLVGLRLGATLAALVGAQRGDVDNMILWEPVLRGSCYLDELEARHREWLRGSFARPRGNRRMHTGDVAGDGGVRELLGFGLSESLAAAIARVDLRNLQARPASSVLVLENMEESCPHPIWAHFRSLGSRVDHRFVPAPPVWIKHEGDAADILDGCLVPSNALSSAVGWLTDVNG